MPAPNFVFILTDTQGVNVLGAYGHPELRTPHIDRLATQGITFERAYTTCPLCTPARAGLFTGRYAHTAGAWVNGLPLGSTVKHMGQRFADQGYRTAYTGKWHLDGHDYFGNGLCPDGWDDAYWYDARRHLESLNPEQRTLWRQGLRSIEALQDRQIGPEFTFGHQVSNRAIQFLETAQRHGDQPFLLVVSYDEPHGPFTCPPEYAEPFRDYRYPLGPSGFDDLANKPVYQQEWAAARRNASRDGFAHQPLYFGCNSFVDAEIGRVLAAVDRHAAENTWVIFTSDHGEMLGSHGLGGKSAAVYEEIAHIPLIVRPPRAAEGMADAGARLTTTVGHIDLLPTMLGLAGLPVPAALEGQTLEPLLRGEEAPERSAFVEFHRFELPGDGLGGFFPMRAIVRGSYKLAINLLDTDELYDLASDPAEVQNRIDDPAYAAIRDRLHDALLDWMYANRDPFRSPAWERRPWRQQRRLTWGGGWSGQRRGWDDGYARERLNYGSGLPLGE
ncbi:MAG TPA: sulfatase-like hydrolase/transferase [Dehalococcoidia bacterium]|jgi:uncharacterized sulfatase